jgi:DNA-binding response OmpR family regulator
MKLKVLIISDEAETARVWGFTLGEAGLDVTLIGIADPVLEVWAELLPDLIIIEDFNAEVEELELCRRLREETVVPLLYLTAKLDEAFLLETYKAGADETIPFPITPRLFQAKVKAWLRRTQSLPLAALDGVRKGGFLLDPESRRLVLPTGEVVNLSVLESRLLYVLMGYPGKAFDSTQLVERVWGYYGEGNNSLLKVLVYRLRRKIEPDPARPRYLLTVDNSGYAFEPGEAGGQEGSNGGLRQRAD